MADPRIEQLADILVFHSIKAGQGDKVLIHSSTEATPLIREVYRRLLRAGAHPVLQIDIPGLTRMMLDEGDDEQLAYAEHRMLTYQHVDALIQIMAEPNTKELTGADARKMQIRQKANRPAITHMVDEKQRWVTTRFPTWASAQDAEMPLEHYENFFYGATNVDYAEMRGTMERAAAAFDEASEVRVVGSGTDLKVNIEGRKGIICAGENNVPDGEFYYTPNHLLTEGVITFDWPTVYRGREVQGVRLVFEKGKVVQFSAAKGEDALKEALETDEGSKYLGELGIGANFGIEQPTKEILFDEKIGGSIHIALGKAYAIAGEGNESAIHWDLIKGLKDGGEIYLDGKLVQKNGRWVR